MNQIENEFKSYRYFKIKIIKIDYFLFFKLIDIFFYFKI